MTTYNKSQLKTYFETNDVPDGSDYGNLIDSQVNIAETAEQIMAGPLNCTEFISPRVSATNGSFVNASVSNIVSANGIYATDIQVNRAFNVTGSAYFNESVFRQGIQVSANVSAADSVYASAMRSNNGYYSPVVIVSATGSTQATAALITGVITRAKGVVDGSTTGFILPSNRTGLVQYIFNDVASANLYPPTGGTINGLSSNAAFSMVASTPYTIIHLTASSYAVG